MASGSSQPTDTTNPKNVLCKYYVNNVCKQGNKCPFSHDRTSTRTDNVCRFYVSGNCSYGSRCRYDHKRPKDKDRKQQKISHFVSLSPEHGIESARDSNQHISGLEEDCPSVSSHSFNADAAPFVPSWLQTPEERNQTYAQAVGAVSVIPLCPYFECGYCEKGDQCELVHGNICDMCNMASLHPLDPEQNIRHRMECVSEHEAAMEEAFGEARSQNKPCAICLENVREGNMRFGILENCNHCFCLKCIREWRNNECEQLHVTAVRGCPICRTHSNYVIPSKYWVEDLEDKKKLIEGFHTKTRSIPCMYLKEGRLEDCPFGDKCFYKHEIDGKVVLGESPHALRRRRTVLSDFLFTDSVPPESDSNVEEDLSTLVRGLFHGSSRSDGQN